MSDILSSFIVLLVLGVIGLVAFFLARRRQAAIQADLETLARQRGWTLEDLREPLLWGLRLTAPGWMLESISHSSGREAGPGSSSTSMSTLWQAARPGSTIMLGPRSSASSLGDALIRRFVRSVTGEDLAEVTIADPSLRSRFMLRARDPLAASSWQSPALASALLEWKKSPPLLARDASGLRIELNGVRLKTPAEVLAFLRIAEALLEANPQGDT